MYCNLKLVLDSIWEADVTYHWGYPFHLLVCKGNRSFTLQMLNQLLDLFTPLDIPAIPVPGWTSLELPPRPQRSRSSSAQWLNQWRPRPDPLPREPSAPMTLSYYTSSCSVPCQFGFKPLYCIATKLKGEVFLFFSNNFYSYFRGIIQSSNISM